jgi:hypothetical protein
MSQKPSFIEMLQEAVSGIDTNKLLLPALAASGGALAGSALTPEKSYYGESPSDRRKRKIRNALTTGTLAGATAASVPLAAKFFARPDIPGAGEGENTGWKKKLLGATTGTLAENALPATGAVAAPVVGSRYLKRRALKAEAGIGESIAGLKKLLPNKKHKDTFNALDLARKHNQFGQAERLYSQLVSEAWGVGDNNMDDLLHKGKLAELFQNRRHTGILAALNPANVVDTSLHGSKGFNLPQYLHLNKWTSKIPGANRLNNQLLKLSPNSFINKAYRGLGKGRLLRRGGILGGIGLGLAGMKALQNPINEGVRSLINSSGAE